MTSRRNIEDRLLDAARDCILSVGWKRTTLTDIARQAGLSRMTIYRAYPDMPALFGDLMTREWGAVLGNVVEPADEGAELADVIARRVTSAVAALRENALFRRIVDVDPELLLPYLIDRRGRSQEAVIDTLTGRIAEAQQTGQVRAGSPPLIARAILLAAHGYALSVHTMADAGISQADLDAELTALIRNYLTP